MAVKKQMSKSSGLSDSKESKKPSAAQKVIKKSAASKTITKSEKPKSKDEAKKGRLLTAEGWKRKTMAELGKPRPKKTMVIPS
ncbi:hypothetical protein [Criblamydia sequanensis]|uniref:Uncharacterized protein n=1 Tax=Candidatus Criblamydia sequanensis CRIB-18 TaxID=1437425 RepID=A0A090DZM3_9BACT|nr:hypothetical protein [Criblamydia sequanensis]CDR34094.1 Hypothetical protein CSEC_1274 [Criblamydia sequanensis CRIB-18]